MTEKHSCTSDWSVYQFLCGFCGELQVRLAFSYCNLLSSLNLQERLQDVDFDRCLQLLLTPWVWVIWVRTWKTIPLRKHPQCRVFISSRCTHTRGQQRVGFCTTPGSSRARPEDTMTFKNMYRARMDSLAADSSTADRMVKEANYAFFLNTRSLDY